MKLEGSVVIITGGGSGIGFATTVAAVEKGAFVSIFDLSDSLCANFVKDHSKQVLFCKVDVTDEKTIESAFENTLKKFGRVDVLVNSAGVSSPNKVLDRQSRKLPLESFTKAIDINLTGSFNVLRYFVEQIAKQNEEKKNTEEQSGKKETASLHDGDSGVIINIASIAAFEGQPGQSGYAASKGGIVAMTLPLARELASYKIRVNTVAPGVFHTPMVSALPKFLEDGLLKQVTFPKRLGDPLELANAVLFLVENTYTNGTVIRVDGGIRLAAL